MKVSIANMYKEFPATKERVVFNRWFSIDRYWGGKLIKIAIKQFVVSIDLRSKSDLTDDLIQ